ncbi:hypothetical protein TWF192_005159 [Orbilia oligospora]|nr:hypothetical protein TWF192_005159 [Orbilia oligospora]
MRQSSPTAPRLHVLSRIWIRAEEAACIASAAPPIDRPGNGKCRTSIRHQTLYIPWDSLSPNGVSELGR